MASATPPSKLKNPKEMELIREKQALLDAELIKNRKGEPNVATPLAYFEIARYTSGSFRGLFLVAQLIAEDEKGKTLKKPVRKVVADGVDIFVAITSLENAVRKRVYK